MFFNFQNPNEEISIDIHSFKIFSWLSPYLKQIVEFDEFNIMTTIELDATFDALEPYVICIPVIINRNTGIPLGLLVSISESTSLYSLFFESLKQIDIKKPNLNFSYYYRISHLMF